MENAEEIQLVLERYSRLKPKEIPEELEEYMGFVAKTGDTVFKWPLIQHLFREKLMNVITDFHDSSPSITDLPHYPNVDPFNFELMKKNLIERMESFNSAPFTIQRICELLTDPRKQYSRIDKFMRAIEKNILVVSTTEPGRTRHESENGESLDSTVNGDLMSEGNLDVGSSEEEQNMSENQLPAAAAALDEGNGTSEQPVKMEPQTIDPLTAVDNPDIDVPLEKLEPEVNVLTIETNEPLLKSIEDAVSDDTPKEMAEDVPESADAVQPSEVVPATNVSIEMTPETEIACANIVPVSEEIKSEEEPATVNASPVKRLIEEENEIPVDENVSKKIKIDGESTEEVKKEEEGTIDQSTIVVPEVNPETISTDEAPTNSNEVETIVPQDADLISHVEQQPQQNDPIISTEAVTTEIVGVEVLPDTPSSLLLDPTTTATTVVVQESEPTIQPLPPIETIVQETNNMEQQVVMTNPVANPVVTPEDEDLMKVDAAPLVNSENKMQTDDVDETAASAMDVDECSADFIME